MSWAPELKTHAQKVCSLYKRAARTMEAYYVGRPITRYHQVQLRDRFEKNRRLADEKEARFLLYLGEEELFNKQNPLMPAKFSKSFGIAGGVAAARVVLPPDWVLDYWHPIEKAVYPEYFKRRELRKCEYVQHWYNNTMY